MEGREGRKVSVLGPVAYPAGHGLPLLLAQDLELEAFAPLVAPKDPEELGWDGGLPAVHCQNHVAPFEPEFRVPGCTDHQNSAAGAEVLAEIGVERGELQVGQGRAVEEAFWWHGHAPGDIGAEPERHGPAAGPAFEHDVLLIRRDDRDGFPVFPPAKLD